MSSEADGLARPIRGRFFLFALFGLSLLTSFNPQNSYFAYADENVAEDAAGEEVAEEAVQAATDDDKMPWKDGLGFDQVSMMPISCVKYNGKHLIKYQLFEYSNGMSQCHSKNLGTYTITVARFMRANFNYQALLLGEDFSLPNDAGYLDCVMLQETAYSDVPLYAKIGCLERKTFTSTKLKIHVYTDSSCSVPYDDGQSSSESAKKGYVINGYNFSNKVSFRPTFYTCTSCSPEQVSATFSKEYSYWYDDVVNVDQEAVNDDAQAYYQAQNLHDDVYYRVQKYANNQIQKYKVDDDDFYTVEDDRSSDDYYANLAKQKNKNSNNNNNNNNGQNQQAAAEPDDDGDDFYTRRNMRKLRVLTPVDGALEMYHTKFWTEVNAIRSRLLEENADGADQQEQEDDGLGLNGWNMCRKLYNLGEWCDAECRALDSFRADQWTKSDIVLLATMCVFMAAMMLLIFTKRVKAYEKAAVFGDDADVSYPGLPPMAMGLLFILIMSVVVIMANLRLVNETLVFAVVTCILLFIYMLKLTLFETRSSSGSNSLHPRVLGRSRSRLSKTGSFSSNQNPLI